MLSVSNNGYFTRQAANRAAEVGKTAERMSSARRINRASDDAAGLSIAESLRTQVRGGAQAARNIQDGIQIVKFGIDGIQGTFSVLQRLRELVLQAANGTYSPNELGAIQGELDSLKRQIPEAYIIAMDARIAYDGDPADRSLDIQTGANAGESMRIDYNPLRNDMLQLVVGLFGYNELYDSEYGGLAASVTFPASPPAPNGVTDAMWPKRLVVDPNTQENISEALTLLDEGLANITKQVTYLGAQINRMEHALDNVLNQTVQMGASESQIRDADMAMEATRLAKEQITQQAATAAVAKSQIKPTLVLELVLSGAEEGRRSAEAAGQG